MAGFALNTSGFRRVGASVAATVALDELNITDYVVGENWYQAILDALAAASALGGGKIYFPARAATYDVDPTAVISIDTNHVQFVGDGWASNIRNISTTGVSLFTFGGSGTRLGCVFRDLYIDSVATAGHIFVGGNGFTFGRFENIKLRQLSLDTSILYASYVTGQGCFNNKWIGGNYEHGSASTAPTTPAFDIITDGNRWTDNTFAEMRWQCRDNTAPFFRLTNSSAANYCYNNEFREIEVENCRRGLIHLQACLGTDFAKINYYDSDSNLDDHLIKLAAGSGGRTCEQTTLRSVHRVSGDLIGVSGSSQSVTSITRSGAVATLTATAHGYAVGQRIFVAGADQTEYNGRFTVVSVTANDLTYAVSGTPATPATGTITVNVGAMDLHQDTTVSDTVTWGCGGTSSAIMEFEWNSNPGISIDSNSQLNHYRESTALGAFMSCGTTPRIAVKNTYTDAINERTAAANITLGHKLALAAAGVAYSGGATITNIIRVAVAIDVGAIALGLTLDVTATVTGASVGDFVQANTASGAGPDSIADGLTWCCWVSAADTVTVRLSNNSATASINPSNRTWNFLVTKAS